MLLTNHLHTILLVRKRYTYMPIFAPTNKNNIKIWNSQMAILNTSLVHVIVRLDTNNHTLFPPYIGSFQPLLPRVWKACKWSSGMIKTNMVVMCYICRTRYSHLCVVGVLRSPLLLLASKKRLQPRHNSSKKKELHHAQIMALYSTRVLELVISSFHSLFFFLSVITYYTNPSLEQIIIFWIFSTFFIVNSDIK